MTATEGGGWSGLRKRSDGRRNNKNRDYIHGITDEDAGGFETPAREPAKAFSMLIQVPGRQFMRKGPNQL